MCALQEVVEPKNKKDNGKHSNAAVQKSLGDDLTVYGWGAEQPKLGKFALIQNMSAQLTGKVRVMMMMMMMINVYLTHAGY